MVKKTVDAPDSEPNTFEKPSEGEHTFQVVDVIENENTPDIVAVKCESKTEEGRSLLHRLNLDENFKGFFAVRLFLKAIGEQYKGKGLVIDSDNWIGREFTATVVYNEDKNDPSKIYANIGDYNFEKTPELGWDDNIK